MPLEISILNEQKKTFFLSQTFTGPKAETSDGCVVGERRVNSLIKLNEKKITFLQLAYADVTSFNSLESCLQHLYVGAIYFCLFNFTIRLFYFSLATFATTPIHPTMQLASIGFYSLTNPSPLIVVTSMKMPSNSLR